MKRRDFLLISGTGLSSLSLSGIVNAAICSDLPAPDVREFTPQDWRIIAAVQNHIFPSEDQAPGAVEIQALRYLHNYLANPATNPEDVKFIHSGSRQLQQFDEKNHSIPFTQLSIDEREKLLREFETRPEDRRWLITILTYVLESLLTDPVYGGNPDGIGWQWLEHRAGEPRPPTNKRYWLL